MDTFKQKTKVQIFCFFLYEFLGTIALIFLMSINPLGGDFLRGAMTIFVLTFICWDVCPAQFNSSLALSQFIFNIEDFKNSAMPFVVTLAAQLGGTFIGYLLTAQVAIYQVSYTTPFTLQPAENSKYIF